MDKVGVRLGSSVVVKRRLTRLTDLVHEGTFKVSNGRKFLQHLSVWIIDELGRGSVTLKF